MLIAISVIGAVVRHWFNLHGQGQKNAWILPLAALAMLSLVIALKPPPPPPIDEAPSWEEVSAVFEERCIPCHADTPTFSPYDLVGEPPLGFSMSHTINIEAKADVIAQQVRSRAMPQGNVTGITDAERQIILDWYDSGAEVPLTSP